MDHLGVGPDEHQQKQGVTPDRKLLLDDVLCDSMSTFERTGEVLSDLMSTFDRTGRYAQ